MRKIILIMLGIFILVLAGCSKTPMDKLASDAVYADMNNQFWKKEKDTNSDLWSKALAYCNQNNAKPNCNPVISVSMIGNTKLMPLNSNPLNTYK